jgi:hypothetical protein
MDNGDAARSNLRRATRRPFADDDLRRTKPAANRMIAPAVIES